MFALAPKLNRAGARQFSTLLDASLDMLRSAWELRHRWQVTTVSQGPAGDVACLPLCAKTKKSAD